MNFASFVVNRLKEPSTYAGLGALLATAGVHMSDTTLSSVVTAATGVAGLAAVFMSEKKSQ